MRHSFLTRLKAGILLSTALVGINAAYGGALPSGGTVQSGTAAISSTATTTAITQSSKTAIINWNSFSIGKGNTVSFSNGSGATLNRVTGTDISTIAGNLNATGTIYLINANGVVITSTGKIVTGGSFVASTRDISDDDFKKGKNSFSGTSDGTVVNAGMITSKTGDAILIGRSVSNSGTISAENGTAGLAAGDTITYTPASGDARITVESSTRGSVTNSGAIKAAQVELNAADGNVYAIAGDDGGIDATGTSTVDGHIWLTGGSVDVSGTVTASNRDGTGGDVDIRGDKITLTDANISVKGTSGAGGAITIGSWDSTSVDIDSDSTVDASAGSNGDGGTVSVIAQSNTVAGTIKAEGGAESGDGGAVETSGDVLYLSGISVSTLAANGETGTWTLDPYNVTISYADTYGNYEADRNNTVINASDLETALSSSNVNIYTGANGTQAGNITIETSLNLTNNTLALLAAGDIDIEASITLSDGASLTAISGYNTTAGDINVDAAISLGADSALTLTAESGSININALITAEESNAVTLTYGDELNFGSSASISYETADDDDNSLTINSTVYTLIYSTDDLATDLAGLTGNYALATSLNASSTATDGWTPIGTSSSKFSGIFEGLGNTISNLTISPSDSYVGLFGYSSGTIRDIGLIDASVSSSRNFVGALVGYSSGTIINAYATGAVTGGDYYVGGLVGYNTGVIESSYATGSVSGSAYVGGLVGYESGGTITGSYATGSVSGSSYVGGLAGYIKGTITGSYATGSVSGSSKVGGLAGYNRFGTITGSYATGSVSGSSYVGGLVGQNYVGSITGSYATGYVTGSSDVGGVVGYDLSGTYNKVYWDTDTSGTTTGFGYSYSTTSTAFAGYTTAELQSLSISDLFGDDSAWATVVGLYPYLSSFYSSTPVAVTGTAYSDAGATVAVAESVSLLIDGTDAGRVSTGANGYYYVLVDADAISTDGSAVLAYTDAGARLQSVSTSANLTDYDIWGGYVTVSTDATSLKAADYTDLLAQAAGDYSDVISFVNSLTSAYLVSSDFDIDVDADGSLAVISQDDADITISVTQTVADGESFTVSTGGDLEVDAAVTVTDDTSGVLNITTGSLTIGSDGNIDYGSSDTGGSLSINGASYTLIYSLSELADISDDLTGDYALATAIDASDTATDGWTPIGTSSSKFSGIFEGLGNTISNLTISSTENNVGLFGYSTGTIRDIGLINADVTGDTNVGALVGISSGTIINAYATGSVTGGEYVGGLVGRTAGLVSDSYADVTVSGSADYVGGLVGISIAGEISDSYAMGSVTGTDDVGGLVGYSNSTKISDSYATGSVTGSADSVGGLVGYNYKGTISDSYATGYVTGSSYVGGVVGYDDGGSYSNVFWDTETSGTRVGIGSNENSTAVTGLTTSELQGSLPAGFDSDVWGTGTGLYPYLSSFYSSTPVAVSGTAYSDDGATATVAESVSLLIDGTDAGTVSTGANGYYYVLVDADEISSTGSAVLAYSDAGATLESVSTSANLTDYDIWGGYLIAPTTATSLTSAGSLQDENSALLAQATGDYSDVLTFVNTLTSYGYIVSADFDIDEDPGSSLYVKDTGSNTITISEALTFSDEALTLITDGDLDVEASVTASGSGVLNITAGSLTIGSNGNIDYGSTDNGSTLTINDETYTLIYVLSELADISSDLTGNYALATALDATSTATDGWTPIGDNTTAFSGIFEGLGNTITNLTVSSTENNVGLFGYLTGTIRDIGLIDASVSSSGNFVGGLVGYVSGGTIIGSYATGSVSGNADVGGLVGYGFGGTITGSYATGSVSGSGNNIGGLVGYRQYGTITGSYATGSVSGSADYVGGLVGYNNSGTITGSYAMGSVSGDEDVGGLVGYVSGGTITDSYATGYVTGTEYVGGVIGYLYTLDGGVFSNLYWDKDTSGTTVGIGSNENSIAATGYTTEQFQAIDITSLGFDSSIWATADGLYPYLSSFYSSTPVAVSGTAYSDAGATVAVAESVSLLIDGTDAGTASTGANGYYYILLDADEISADGSAVLAYSDSGARLESVSTSANLTDYDIWGGYLIAPTTATSLTSAGSLLDENANLLAQAAGDYSDVISFVNSLSPAYLVSSDFDIDVDADGALAVISQDDADITISVKQTVGDGESFTVSTGGDLDVEASVTASGSGVLNITTGSLTIGSDGNIDYGSSDNGGSLSINGASYTLIYSMSELQAINADSTSLSGDYALATAIDASDTATDGWTPIGDDTTAFSGIFEGLGNTISNLTVSSSDDYVGLFGYSTGTIRDIGLIDASVSSSGNYVGALVGYSTGTTTNSYATGLVSGSAYVGALAGYNGGTIINSYANGAVTGSLDVGGLVGLNKTGTISDSYATGSVSSSIHAGGLVGRSSYATISDSYATGSVTGSADSVGGLVGYIESGTITGSYATGSVSGNSEVGGLVGYIESSTITGSYATGSVSGNSEVGGLVGYIFWESTITGSYATGSVSGSGIRVGGLVGYVEEISTISDSYATGNVTGSRYYVGGLVGENYYGTITGSYATGSVTGGTEVGGVVGYNVGGTYSNVYWDTDTSGTSVGIGNDESSTAVTGLYTSDLQGSLPAGFDSDVWGTGTGLYPYLSSFYSSAPVAITGYLYSAYDTSTGSRTAAAGSAVSLLVDGSASGTASTGANGYYYILVDSDAISDSGSDLFAYVSDGSLSANGLYEDVTGSVENFYLMDNGLFAYNVSEESLSDLISTLYVAAGDTDSSYLLFDATALSAGIWLTVHSSGAFDIDIAVDADLLEVEANGDITQSAAISADTLVLYGDDISLTNSSNTISAIVAEGDAIDVYSSTDLTVASFSALSGITASGAVTLTSVGDITIADGAIITAGEDSDVVLAATGAFINNEGSDAITVSGSGRWLIYSASSDGDTFGGLDSENTAIWGTAAGDTVSATGNRYVFAEGQTVVVTADNAEKTYGDSVSLTYSVSGLSAGVDGAYEADSADDILSGALYSDGAVVTADANSYAISQGTLTAANGYSISFTSGTLTVDTRAITITADDLESTYGDDTDDLTYTITTGSLVNDDTLSGSLTSDASSTADAGTYSIGQGTLANSNYDITYVAGTYTINTRAITITADDLSSTYGEAIGDLTYTITSGSLAGDDTISVSLSTSATSTSNVGDYTLAVESVAVSSNYAVTYVDGTYTITARPITITADDLESTYGDATEDLTYTIGGDGLVTGDSATVELTTTASSTSDAGTYTITVSDVDVSSNYVVTTVTNGTYTINTRAITVTATDESSTYGDATSDLAYTITSGNLVGEDTLTGSLTSDASSTADAGTYSIAQGTLSASDNYDITYVAGTYTINTRAITITADDLESTYGDDTEDLTYTITSGSLVNDDTLSGSLTSDASSTADAGSYSIAQGTLSASANYDVTYVAGTYTINTRAIMVTATDESSTYGDATSDLAYTITSGSLVNDDTLSGSLTTDASSTADAGTYTIAQGTLANSNYDITYVSGTYTIDTRAITITADDLESTYGDATEDLTYTITSGSLVNDDTLSGSLTTDASSTADAGSYSIAQGTLSASDNYDVTYVAGTYTINTRAITITADDLESTYGDANGNLTYTITSGSLVNDDTLSGSLTTDASSTADAGTYTIAQGTLSASDNYDITYVSGTYTIDTRAITITADDLESTYGDDTEDLTYTITSGSLVNEDTLTGSLTSDASSTADAGSYSIAQGTLSASDNYDVTFVAGTYTIDTRAITVTAADESSTYGDASSDLTYTITSGSLVNDDTLSGSLTSDASSTADAGDYEITQGTLSASDNYDVTYVAGTYTIDTRAITVTAADESSTYGDDTEDLTYTITSGNLVGEDTLTGSLTTDASSTADAGTYTIAQGTLSASANYDITYVSGTYTINTRAITITADDLESTYGDDTEDLTYTITSGNLVGDDTLSGSLTTDASSTADAGTYSIAQGTLSASDNYDITYVAGTYTINTRAITITADDLETTYGDATSDLTYSITTGSLVNDDTLSGSLTSDASSTADAGDYEITQGTLSASANYDVTYVAGTYTIDTRAITVTASDESSTYGDATEDLTYTITSGSLVNDDTLSGSLTTDASATADAGTYTIAQGTLSASANYDITYVAGTYTITAADSGSGSDTGTDTDSMTASEAITEIGLDDLIVVSAVGSDPYGEDPNSQKSLSGTILPDTSTDGSSPGISFITGIPGHISGTATISIDQLSSATGMFSQVF